MPYCQAADIVFTLIIGSLTLALLALTLRGDQCPGRGPSGGCGQTAHGALRRRVRRLREPRFLHPGAALPQCRGELSGSTAFLHARRPHERSPRPSQLSGPEDESRGFLAM